MFRVLAVILNIVGGEPAGELGHLHGQQTFDTIEACYRYVQENEGALRGAVKGLIDADASIPDGTIYRVILTCNDGSHPNGTETNAPRDPSSAPKGSDDWLAVFVGLMRDMKYGFGTMKD